MVTVSTCWRRGSGEDLHVVPARVLEVAAAAMVGKSGGVRLSGSCGSGDRRPDGGRTLDTRTGCGRVGGGGTGVRACRLPDRRGVRRASGSGPPTDDRSGRRQSVRATTQRGTPAAIEAYAGVVGLRGERYGVSLGEPRFDDDDWDAKLEVLLDLRPAVASFTFGLPSADEVRRLRRRGHHHRRNGDHAGRGAAGSGAGRRRRGRQGPCGGRAPGHVRHHRAAVGEPLDDLLASIIADLELPVIAAGGLIDAGDVGEFCGRGGRRAAGNRVPARRRSRQQSGAPGRAEGSAVH